MTAPQVNAFFQDYVAAFVAQDIDHICSMWTYPAFMVFDGRQRVFEPEPFRDNAVRLCRFYVAQGMSRATKELVDLVPLTVTTAAVTTLDTMYRTDDTTIARWRHAYLLSESADRLSIVAAMPDDENRAWRELRAPMSQSPSG
jgi:hypothetical protein